MIKINIRYCTQFGNYTTKTHTLKKDYSVRELKAVIQELSEIEPSEQSLLIIHNNCKVEGCAAYDRWTWTMRRRACQSTRCRTGARCT